MILQFSKPFVGYVLDGSHFVRVNLYGLHADVGFRTLQVGHFATHCVGSCPTPLSGTREAEVCEEELVVSRAPAMKPRERSAFDSRISITARTLANAQRYRR